MDIIYVINFRVGGWALFFLAFLSCVHASEEVVFKSKIVGGRDQFIAQVGIARLGGDGGAKISALLIQRVVMSPSQVGGAVQSCDPRVVPVNRAETQVQLRWDGGRKRFVYIGPRNELKLIDGCVYFWNGERLILMPRYSIEDVLFVDGSDVERLILGVVAEASEVGSR